MPITNPDNETERKRLGEWYAEKMEEGRAQRWFDYAYREILRDMHHRAAPLREKMPGKRTS